MHFARHMNSVTLAQFAFPVSSFRTRSQVSAFTRLAESKQQGCAFILNSAYNFSRTSFVQSQRSRKSPNPICWNNPPGSRSRQNSRAIPLKRDGKQHFRCATAYNSVRDTNPTPVIYWIEYLSDIFTSFYWLWILLGALLALQSPLLFSTINGGAYFTAGLFFIMMSMGFTLSREDIVEACQQPKALLAGCFLQYSVMPLVGLACSKLGGLPPPMAVGLILVSCCPGGAASNVVTHVAKGNVPLSVAMTSLSTLLATVLTPTLVLLCAGTYVPVDVSAMAWDVLQLVLFPVGAGWFLSEVVPSSIKAYITPLMPALAVGTSTVLTSAALASTSPILFSAASVGIASAIAAVTATHLGGFTLGYRLSKLIGFDAKVNRTVSIEVGMQSSVMALTLAAKHFSDFSTQLPCALSAVVMNLLGAGLAGFYRFNYKQKKEAAAKGGTV